MNLNILNYNIKINWGEAYLGMKVNMLLPGDLLSLCERNLVINGSDKRYTQLLISLEDSVYDFLNHLKTYIEEDGEKSILINEDSLSENLLYDVPKKYWRIWKLEVLLEIINKNCSIERKLDELNAYFEILNYPEEWEIFLPYSVLNDEDKHNLLKSHIKKEVSFFIERQNLQN